MGSIPTRPTAAIAFTHKEFRVFDQDPTVRSRELGRTLANAARNNGFTGRQVAHKLGWDASRVSRLLSGKRGVKQVDLAAFLAVCDVVGPPRDAALELARDARELTWLQLHGERLPVRLTTLSNVERTASTIVCVATAMVPALLQTKSYRRAALQAQPVIPTEEIEDRVAAGLDRQWIFDRNPPVRFLFFLHEHALTRTGPGRQIMSEQIHDLLRMSVRPHLRIRIVPERLLAHEPFELLEFDEYNPVVYVEHLNSVAFLEREETVACYHRIVTGLDEAALDIEASRAWLTTSAAHFAHPTDDPDLP
ncbi:helix-turn-helix transcriptional regulator [Actinophytocola sp.]|uniref:helix-turn-helix domain-containing protein n=1 Tax=Actinophytocola sp. TaxID=1872138 RepID=UPI002ED96AAD